MPSTVSEPNQVAKVVVTIITSGRCRPASRQGPTGGPCYSRAPMRDFPPPFYTAIRALDRFSDVTGKLISLSMLWLVASISYECFARYLFNAPTVWVLESSYMTNGSAFMLGCAYALHKGAHVRTDMLWEKFSERRKGIIDLTSYLLLFYPTLVILLVISVDDAWYAFSIHEL